MSNKFKPRLTRPEAGNPYYNTPAAGGYNPARTGSPVDPGCNVLANCVGYAAGRIMEIIGWETLKHLQPTTAERWIAASSGCRVSQTPIPGAIAVWAKGSESTTDDGSGHVAVVEEVVNATTIRTSESGWNCTNPFWTQLRAKGTGNWGQSSAYRFLGFLIVPELESGNQTDAQIVSASNYAISGLPTLSYGMQGAAVETLQILLNGRGYSCGEADGIFGRNTQNAVKEVQLANGLKADGVCGKATWAVLLLGKG